MSTIALSFLTILLVFAPPVLILAMVSPLALHFATAGGRHAGKTAGNLTAFSTFGSLLGTFATAFGTIPFWGTKATLLFWSGTLALLSLGGFILVGGGRDKRVGLLGMALLVPVFAANAWTAAQLEVPGTVYAKDTLYQYVRVLRATDGTTYLVYNEGGGIQSVHRKGDVLGAGDYYADYLALPFLSLPISESGIPNFNHPLHALVLGSAGGTVLNLLARYDRPRLPNLKLTGVEIDPAVIPLACQYFGLQQKDARMVNQDARVFIRATQNKYDVIMVDAYSQQIYIPFQLTTKEFFQELRSRLTSNGLVALNVNAVSPQSELLLTMEKTVQSVFPKTYLMKARGLYNYVLVGAMHALPLDNLTSMASDSRLGPIADEWQRLIKPVDGSKLQQVMPFTDDRAPVEMMTDEMVFGFLRMGQRPQE